ncbi:MAG TPA: VOC family protein [Pyrinomonadaceae bacterium]|nr:VOC family protein [Pyrinomonadaceae bacterium]
MQINPYLNFNGNCAEAFKFYEQALSGKILFSMTWGEMPGAEQFPAETHSRIMHINLKVGEQSLMGADAPPDRYQEPTGMNVSVHLKDKAEAERVFNALADGGKVSMPFQQTFWSSGFGMCVDQFGIPWMVNTEQESDARP